MKVNGGLSFLKYGGIALVAMMLTSSCEPSAPRFGIVDKQVVTDSVNRMMTTISSDISTKGPIAWLNHFQDTSAFFMANNGELLFKDNAIAKVLIQSDLIKIISKITLGWGNIRIDPLTPSLAAIGADFHEDITLSSGKTNLVNGYFTALAEHTGKGWQLRNCHWSAKTPQ